MTMEVVAVQIKDVAVLRRMLFATSTLPTELPNYWDTVASFGCLGCSSNLPKITPDSAQVAMENLKVLDANAFSQFTIIRFSQLNKTDFILFLCCITCVNCTNNY